MEIDKEKLAEQASQLKDQAAAMVSKVDVTKATGVADACMNKVFFFGKLVSALIMLGCVVAMIGSLVYYAFFCSGASLKAPVFDAAAATDRAVNGDNGTDYQDKVEENAVRKKYQGKIQKLIRIGGLDNSDFDNIVAQMLEYDKSLRSPYINGAVKYFEASKKWHIEKAKKFDAGDCLYEYNDAFEKQAENVETTGLVAKERKATAWGICRSACLGFILFLMIPLLIKIEENTRK